LFVENKQAQWYLLRQILTAFDVDYRLIIGEKPVAENQTPIDIQSLIQTLRGGMGNAGQV
jgi:hypothetical protein